MRHAGTIAALLALATASCAENSIRLEAAQTVSDTSAKAMRSVADYFAQVERRRRAAAAALVASDPSCRPALAFTIQTPETIDRTGGIPLCPAGKTPAPGYSLVALDFGATPEALLKPRLLLIAAVADYGVALAKIVADPEADITGELTAFAEKIDRVSAFVGLLAGSSLPSAGGVLQSDEGKSVLALLEFANMLAHEAEQVRRVRDLVQQDGTRVDAALALLSTIVDKRVRFDIADAQAARVEALADAYDRERTRLDFPARHALATAVLDGRAEQQSLDQTADAVVEAIDEVRTAQLNLRAALDGKFTPEQRRRILAANLDRLTRGLELIANVGTAFL